MLFLTLPLRSCRDLLSARMRAEVYIFSVLFIAYKQSDFNIDIPTSVFWILLILLLDSQSVPRSIGSFLFCLLVFVYLHPKQTYVSPRVFWICFATFWPMWQSLQISMIFSVCLASIVYLLRDRIYLQMPFGWYIVWLWFVAVLATTVSNSMGTIWSIFATLFIIISCVVMHPEISFLRFFLWTLMISILHTALFQLHAVYYYQPQSIPIFPFIGQWKFSRQKWYPVSIRPDTIDDAALCERCTQLTTKSKLIMGSKYSLTRLVEWHESWDSFKQLKCHALNVDSPCHMCNLLWHSVSEERRRKLIVENTQLSQSLAARLTVKIWEERPLSQYTLAQLFQGGNTAIGGRLLIHSGELFEKQSEACLEPSTDSTKHIEQAKRWLHRCEECHIHCKGVGNRPTARNLPTRLLHLESPSSIGSGDSSTRLRLKPTGPINDEIEYVAFSHCWGVSSTFTLLLENYDSSIQSIEISKLSKNARNAVKITKDLGFSYLWIDSLCIIQDSLVDKEREFPAMGDVYSGAVCTIASTGSSSSEGGCFHERNPLSLRPCKIAVSSPVTLIPVWKYLRRDDVFDFERNVDRSPLNKRAWVLQERLLSRRILHFGAEMLYWECCRRSASELNPNGYIFKTYPDDFADNFAPNAGGETHTDRERDQRARSGQSWAGGENIHRRPPPVEFDPDNPQVDQSKWQLKREFWKEVRKPSTEEWEQDSESTENAGLRAAFEKLQNKRFSKDQVGLSSFSHCWYEVVGAHSRGDLTHQSDKLNALAGITQEIKEATKYHHIAGLWEEHLLTDLLWFMAEGPGRRITDAPSTTPAEGTTPDLAIRPTPGSAEEQGGLLLPETTEENGPQNAAYTAPTWSWASLEGIVGLDLLPDNSVRSISLKERLATVTYVRSRHEGESGHAPIGILNIKGPLWQIPKVKSKEGMWFIETGIGHFMPTRVFPDVAGYDMTDDSKLFCMSFLVLSRELTSLTLTFYDDEIQGLVLRLREERDGLPNIFERVGFFRTSRFERYEPGHGIINKLKGATVGLVQVI